MHVTLNVKHAPKLEGAQELLERERERIERHLGGVPGELVSIHCELDQNPHQREAYASLTVSLPDKTLNARSTGPNLLAALRRSANAVVGELDRKRGRERRAARVRVALGAEAEIAQATFDRGDVEERAHVIRRGVAELYRFVRLERDRHERTLQSEEVGAIEIPDVVDDAIVRAMQSDGSRPDDVPFDRWLISCAYDVLIERESEVLRRVAGVSLEDEVPDEPGSSDMELAEEMVRRPGRVYRSDVTVSHDQSPEEMAARRQLGAALTEILAELNPSERGALQALAADGPTVGERGREELLATAECARDRVLSSLRGRGLIE